MTAIVNFLAYDVIMVLRFFLFMWFQLFLSDHLLCKVGTVNGNAGKSNIEITLISPDVSVGVETGEVDLEGLVNDLSVREVKLLINAQDVQFVPVIKGYFNKKVYLLERSNRLTIYGSNSVREAFRYEFNIINNSQREKSLDERIPPEIQLNYLQEDIFKVISPNEFEGLQVEIKDNKNDIVQLAYIVNDDTPVYLPRNKRFVRLEIERSSLSKSIELLIYAIDGDGNRATKRYHFRVEDLGCKLSVSPEYGIYSKTPVRFHATVKGGVGKIKKLYTLVNKSGVEVVHETYNPISQVYLSGRKMKDDYKASLKIVDQNGIEATCKADIPLKFYPENFPKSFKILDQTKLQSVRQDLHFSIEPPILQGEITILLREQGFNSSYLGEDWKVLGRKKFEADTLRRFWAVNLRRRVPVGKYQMKLSVVSDSSEITFTEKIVVEVTKSQDDTEDLLQEILRGE